MPGSAQLLNVLDKLRINQMPGKAQSLDGLDKVQLKDERIKCQERHSHWMVLIKCN